MTYRQLLEQLDELSEDQLDATANVYLPADDDYVVIELLQRPVDVEDIEGVFLVATQ